MQLLATISVRKFLERLALVASLTLVWSAINLDGALVRQPDVKTAERLGRELYEQSTHSTTALSPSFSRAKQAAVAALSQIDRSKYRFEVVKNPHGRGLLVYALAHSKDSGEMVLGVHYRIATTQDGATVQSIEPLSRSPVVLSKTKAIPKGATSGSLWATNLISPTPLETYVYASLLHKTPIFVGAPDHTIWKVDGAQISKIRSGR